MTTYGGNIRTNSPFYYITNGTAGDSSSIELRVWSGSYTADIPTNPTYTLVKSAKVPSATTHVFELSKLIGENFKHTPYTSYNDSMATDVNTLWVKVTNVSSSDSTYYGADDGYLEYGDSISAPLYDNVLYTPNLYYTYEDNPIRIPVYSTDESGSNGIQSVCFFKGTIPYYTNNLTTYAASLFTKDKIVYANVDKVSLGYGTMQEIDNVKLYNSGTQISANVIRTIQIVNISEYKYAPYLVTFINKFGALQDIWFFKKSTAQTTVTKDKYSKFTMGIDPYYKPTYDIADHQYRDYNVGATTKWTLNTGFVDETYNSAIKQLTLSPQVWIKFGTIYYPVQVDSKSLDYKSGLNDNNINYTLTFVSAYNEINNVY